SIETVAKHLHKELQETFECAIKSRHESDSSDDDFVYLMRVLSLPPYLSQEARLFVKARSEVAVSCVRCAAGVHGLSASYDYQCPACGMTAVMARCSSCSGAIQISKDYFKKDFSCPVCGTFHFWDSWNLHRITLGDLADAIPEEP